MTAWFKSAIQHQMKMPAWSDDEHASLSQANAHGLPSDLLAMY